MVIVLPMHLAKRSLSNSVLDGFGSEAVGLAGTADGHEWLHTSVRFEVISRDRASARINRMRCLRGIPRTKVKMNVPAGTSVQADRAWGGHRARWSGAPPTSSWVAILCGPRLFTT